MTKLTDSELVVLSKASQREDRVVELPTAPCGKAAATLERLIERGLIAEIAAARGMPVYRQDDTSNEPRALVITDRGLAAIGLGDNVEDAIETTAEEGGAAAPPVPAEPAAPTGKTALVISLLQREEGASIEALTEATGWLPHSARAALTGLRKKGYAIERVKSVGNASVYRIASADIQAV